MTTSGTRTRRELLLLALAFAALLVAGQLALGGVLVLLGRDVIPARLAAVIGQVVGILAPALLVLPRIRDARAPARALGLPGALAVAVAAAVGWVGAAGMQVATIAGLQSLGWSGLEAARQRVVEAYGSVLRFDGAMNCAVTVLLVCVLAPLFEELAFRGVLQRLLSPALGPAVATTLSALLFAALHFEPLGFLSRFVLGLGCGVLAHRLGTLAGSVALHAGFNGISLALVALIGAPTALGVRPAPEGALIPALVVGLVASAAFLSLVSLAPLGERRVPAAEPA